MTRADVYVDLNCIIYNEDMSGKIDIICSIFQLVYLSFRYKLHSWGDLLDNGLQLTASGATNYISAFHIK